MLRVRNYLLHFALRFTSGKTAAELKMAKLLREKIEGVTKVEVDDVSSGCGSMYSILVESAAFKGLTKVAQHKMVTGVLRHDIKDMHGLSIKTKIPDQ